MMQLGTLEALRGLSSPHGLCCLPPRGIVHYSTLKQGPPPPHCPPTKFLSMTKRVFMNMCGELHSCPRHCWQCNGKKNDIKYCVPCHNLLFNKLTVLKSPDVVVCAVGHTLLFSHHCICFQGPEVVWQNTKEPTLLFFWSVIVQWKPNSTAMFWSVAAWRGGSSGHKNSWGCCVARFCCPVKPPGVSVGLQESCGPAVVGVGRVWAGLYTTGVC